MSEIVEDDVAAEFVDAAQRGTLLMQHCEVCSLTFYYPRRRCPGCLSDALHWVPVSGDGVVYATAVPRGAEDGCVAIVDLGAGLRVTGWVTEGGASSCKVGDAVVWTGPPDSTHPSRVLTFVRTADLASPTPDLDHA